MAMNLSDKQRQTIPWQTSCWLVSMATCYRHGHRTCVLHHIGNSPGSSGGDQHSILPVTMATIYRWVLWRRLIWLQVIVLFWSTQYIHITSNTGNWRHVCYCPADIADYS